MKTPTTPKKLKLNRQTLRHLSTQQLDAIAGGLTYRCINTASECNGACVSDACPTNLC